MKGDLNLTDAERIAELKWLLERRVAEVATLTAERDAWIEKCKTAVWSDSELCKHLEAEVATLTAERDHAVRMQTLANEAALKFKDRAARLEEALRNTKRLIERGHADTVVIREIDAALAQETQP